MQRSVKKKILEHLLPSANLSLYMSRDTKKKLSSGFLTRSDTNQTVQPQKMSRPLKFWIKEVEVLFYPSSENKGADQLI